MQVQLNDSVLRKLKSYRIDIEAGEVFNKEGKRVGAVGNDGYVCVWISNKTTPRLLKRGHIVWWKATGQWPKQYLDHINRDRTDDRFGNLRLVTPRENTVIVYKACTLPKGVSPSKSEVNPYFARAWINGELKYLGSYATPEEASKVYRAAAEQADVQPPYNFL